MLIGLTFTLRTDAADAGRPDDWQEEFDSPETVGAIADALRAAGHEVRELGDGPDLLRRLLAEPPEGVFNIAEGGGTARTREARVPAALELLGIPCTGSDPLTLAAALDKDVARRLVNVAIPAGRLWSPGDPVAPPEVPPPWIVKPAWEGSSKGIRSAAVVRSQAELARRVEAIGRDYGQPVMIEEFIAGDEVTVGLLGPDPPRVLGAMRIAPIVADAEFVYSLEVKRDFRRRVRYELIHDPAVESAALRAYHALGCRDVARIDFRVRDGVPYFLEANPLPGLNPHSSDLVILAGLTGMSHGELVRAILEAAQRRWAEERRRPR